MLRKTTLLLAVLASLALAGFPAMATENGTLDNWDQSSLAQAFGWCRVKIHRIEGHIDTLTFSHKNKESGDAYFHGGECSAMMLSVARGPESGVNFKRDVTTGNVWVDNVTGNRLTEKEEIYEVRHDHDDTSLILGQFQNGAREFVITDMKFASDPPEE